ncbi:MAG: methyltransferase family protein, partial [Cyanobium sp.]
KVGSTLPPEELCESGPYRFVRHPFYSSYIMAIAAFLPQSSLLFSIPILLIIVTMYAFAAIQEERLIITSIHGNAYGQLRERTGMFLPRVSRDRDSD